MPPGSFGKDPMTMRNREAASLILCLAIATATIAAEPTAPSPVDQTEFGVWDADTNGVARLLPTATVPLELGVAYGWRMHLTGSNASVRVKQVLTLPAPPQSWGTNREVRVSADRKVATVERTMRPQDGWVFDVIRVADGDPEGKHTLAISLDGRTVKTFEFETKLDAPFPGD